MNPNNPGQKGPQKDTLKSGTSKRTRAGNERRPAKTPRLIIIAAVVIIGAAALLFWPRGGSVPTGIGEQQSVVVTAPDSTSNATGVAAKKPHSSNVDIAAEGPDIVPESPDGSGLSPEEAAAQAKQIAKAETPAKAKPKTKPKAKPKPVAEEKIIPQENGPWAVQVGAYGEAANADKEAVRLQAKSWDARVRAGNNSNGAMVFRVWIGYFSTRANAETFARQNRRDIPKAIAIHR